MCLECSTGHNFLDKPIAESLFNKSLQTSETQTKEKESLWDGINWRGKTIKMTLPLDSEQKLAPCPFCGGEALVLVAVRRILCNSCGSMGPIADTKEAAIEAWNKSATGFPPGYWP